jgi:hypothetical protein
VEHRRARPDYTPEDVVAYLAPSTNTTPILQGNRQGKQPGLDIVYHIALPWCRCGYQIAPGKLNCTLAGEKLAALLTGLCWTGKPNLS